METKGLIGEKAERELTQPYSPTVIELTKKYNGLKPGFTRMAAKLQRVCGNLSDISFELRFKYSVRDKETDDEKRRLSEEFGKWYLDLCARYENTYSDKDLEEMENTMDLSLEEKMEFRNMPDLYIIVASRLKGNEKESIEEINALINPNKEVDDLFVETLIKEVEKKSYMKRVAENHIGTIEKTKEIVKEAYNG